MNLAKEDLLGIHKDRMKIGASLADVDPMQIDKTVSYFYPVHRSMEMMVFNYC